MFPFKPMSPILTSKVPEGVEWCHQLKWDGVRMIARIQSRNVTLYTKNMRVVNDQFPELVGALKADVTRDCVLDGEAVVVEANGKRPDFYAILKRIRLVRESAITVAARTLPATYAIFDLLSVDERDIRDQPFSERNARLHELIPDRHERLLVTDTFDNGQALWAWVEEHRWEGVVSKKVSGKYRTGKLHRDWHKTKTANALRHGGDDERHASS